jgi:hypothetical protein
MRLSRVDVRDCAVIAEALQCLRGGWLALVFVEECAELFVGECAEVFVGIVSSLPIHGEIVAC